jgi:catalase
LEVDATLETTPSVLFDAVVVPDGTAGAKGLAEDGHTLEFLRDQYRHCKTILAFGDGGDLLERAGIALGDDSGVLHRTGKEDAAVKAFIAAIAKHRHFRRDTDPPTL